MHELDDRPVRPAARLLKALANERRLSILCHLGRGEMSVGQLAGAVGLSLSALSQHLAKLREDGVVTARRRSQTVFYALASAEAAAVIDVLMSLYCPSPETLPESIPEERP